MIPHDGDSSMYCKICEEYGLLDISNHSLIKGAHPWKDIPYSWGSPSVMSMDKIYAAKTLKTLADFNPKNSGQVFSTDEQKLIDLFPHVRIRCPEPKCDQHKNDIGTNIVQTITHINDVHKWSREAIADYIESYAEYWELDISFPVPTTKGEE